MKTLNIDGRLAQVTSQTFLFEEFKIVDLPAGETREANITGTFAKIIEAQGDFQIAFNDQRFIDSDLGLGYILDIGDVFTKVRFKNVGTTPLSVTLNYGYGRIIDDRLNVVDGRLASVERVMPNSTEIVCSATTVINNAASVTFTGVPTGNQIQRKSIIITNEDPNNNLDWTDGANIGGKIFPEQNVELEVAGNIVISNTSGGNISCKISEIWFVIN